MEGRAGDPVHMTDPLIIQKIIDLTLVLKLSAVVQIVDVRLTVWRLLQVRQRDTVLSNALTSLVSINTYMWIFFFHLITQPVCFPVAAPAAPGGLQPAPSHPVPLRWSDPEPCTPGSLPSCATTPPQCRPPSPARHPPRCSPPTRSSRTRLCPPTRLRTPSPSLRRPGGGWRRRGGGTHCSRPNRGERHEAFNTDLCQQVLT